MVSRTGTSRNDVLNGTNSADTLKGMGGNDTLHGQLGNDVLDGGVGNDTIVGHGWYTDANNRDPYYAIINSANGGSDKLGGGAGDDYIIDFDGPSNRLDGGDGRDTLLAGLGKDTLIGGRGDDYMDGGLGSDLYYAGVGNDTISDYSPNPYGADETWYDGLPDNPDADVFYFEANLGKIGADRIEFFDAGADKIKIEDYTHVEVSGGNLDTDTYGFALYETVLSFDDGSTIITTSEDPLQRSDIVGVGTLQVDWYIA